MGYFPLLTQGSRGREAPWIPTGGEPEEELTIRDIAVLLACLWMPIVAGGIMLIFR